MHGMKSTEKGIGDVYPGDLIIDWSIQFLWHSKLNGLLLSVDVTLGNFILSLKD